MSTPASPWWLRVQRALGLWPLTAFAAYHLHENWSAFAGREAWLEDKRAHAHPLWFGCALIALLFTHAVLGALRSWRARQASQPAASSLDAARFQAWSGALLLGFLLYHVPQVWPATDAVYATAGDVYQRLWQQLGRPLHLVAYLVGCAALVLHLTHGWFVVLRARFGRLRLAPRYMLGVAAFVLFALYVQLVGWFALGEAPVPFAAPERDRIERGH